MTPPVGTKLSRQTAAGRGAVELCELCELRCDAEKVQEKQLQSSRETNRTYCESCDALPPRTKTGAVDLSQGLVGQPQVDALWGHRELEGNSLMGFGHDH